MNGKKEKLYNLSIRCYYKENWTNHRQIIKLSKIRKWIEAYQYTHPQVECFSIRVYVKEEQEESNAENKPPGTSNILLF